MIKVDDVHQHRSRRGNAVVWLILAMGILYAAPTARAADTEGCLICHRYRGLARLDEANGRARFFYVNPAYYDRVLGAHARLRCTECHERGAVGVVPHRTVAPVDCGPKCHLTSLKNVEIVFGHDTIRGMLEQSAHPAAVLEQCNTLLGEPLGPGQSRCLLCHTEPTYRRGGMTWVQQESPVNRCNVCHDQRVPIDTPGAYWHVYARSLPAYNNQEMIAICAICHSNSAIRTQFKLTDSTASYLASFHGKGALLGDQQTANCLDCHIGPLQNVHEMQSHRQAGAPTGPENRADTCRSPRCHPLSGRLVSSAAIHVQVATSRGIEFFIAAVFVLLIVSTFGPSALLTVLDMLQILIGRHDPADKVHHELAVKLMADPRGQHLLKRFTPFQRVQHWILVVSFALLVFTGFPMKFADRAWAAWIVDWMGGLFVARIIHRWAGAILILGFLYHLLFYVGGHLLKEKKRSGKSFFRTLLDLPLVINLDDFKKMGQYIAFLCLLRKSKPKWGRFSLEEKFEYVGVLWGTILLGATGLLMWNDALTSRYLPGRFLTVANLIHGFEAYLALLHVGVVHLAGVILSPGSFPTSPAMFTGNTPIAELAESHPALLDQVQRQLQQAAPSGPNEAHEGRHA